MAMRMCYRPYMFSPALQPLLGRINVPTLIVWGAEDQVIPPECGEMYRDAIPGASLKVLERCGHWPHYEQPQELADMIKEFVSK
jgi:pimeloyl-ACP methyl ester carboxylesterase